MEGYQLSDFEAHLRKMILDQEIDEPIVFKGIHSDWVPCTWSLQEWGKLFKSEKLSVRYGQQNWDGIQPQWESECSKVDLTWDEIIAWKNGEYKFIESNGGPDKVWVYYDYRYLPDVFQLTPNDGEERNFLKIIQLNENLKKAFSWAKLGFPDRNSDHSTLWCGSKGSYTPCHFDTYSCNLVCQVYGRKTWLLFPPDDTEHLRPTRIPYEESSVYSSVNFCSPRRLSENIEYLGKCCPRLVTLEAGDCLFLPSKWWHFVKSDDFSISVNTWIELPGDHSVRVEEAVLRTITSAISNMTFPDVTKKILNPNEMDVAEMNELELNEMLQVAASNYMENQRKEMLLTSTDCDTEPVSKKHRFSNLSFQDFLKTYPVCRSLTQVTMQDILNRLEGSTSEIDAMPFTYAISSSCNQKSPTYLEHLINAVGQPSILKQITNEFLRNVARDPPK